MRNVEFAIAAMPNRADSVATTEARCRPPVFVAKPAPSVPAPSSSRPWQPRLGGDGIRTVHAVAWGAHIPRPRCQARRWRRL